MIIAKTAISVSCMQSEEEDEKFYWDVWGWGNGGLQG